MQHLRSVWRDSDTMRVFICDWGLGVQGLGCAFLLHNYHGSAYQCRSSVRNESLGVTRGHDQSAKTSCWHTAKTDFGCSIGARSLLGLSLSKTRTVHGSK